MEDHKITLYLRPGSSSIFPHILLNELGIDFEAKGVTYSTITDDAEFARVNQKHQVPVLTIDGETVTENPAIAQAIQSLRPEHKILGQNTQEFIKVCEWLNWLSASFHAQAFSPYLRPWRFTTSEDGEAAVKAKAREKVMERFGMVEGWLRENCWAVGQGFTAVDAYLLPFFMWGSKEFGQETKRFVKYGQLVEKVRARESVTRALRREEEIMEGLGGDVATGSNR